MKTVLFIYNADAGLVNAVKDSWKKFSDPENYACNLCALTYGYLSEKKQWKAFRKNSNLRMEFLHRDEFEKHYASKFGAKFELPVVLEENPCEGLQVLVSHDQLNQMTGVKELIESIEERVKN